MGRPIAGWRPRPQAARQVRHRGRAWFSEHRGALLELGAYRGLVLVDRELLQSWVQSYVAARSLRMAELGQFGKHLAHGLRRRGSIGRGQFKANSTSPELETFCEGSARTTKGI